MHPVRMPLPFEAKLPSSALPETLRQTLPMKSRSLVVPVLALCLSSIGCETKTATSPAVVETFQVDGNTGMAEGRVLGIDFNVEGATGAEISSEISGSPASPSHAELTLADDLKIDLKTTDEGGSVAFQLNGKSFGTLKKGDKVTVKKDRSVTVNGEARTSGAAPSE